MRTKTLLIAAAALAATVTASQAQTVYSQNVVGYINITVTNNTLVMAANQLDTGSNTLDNVLSSGVASKGTYLLQWNGSGYNSYQYYNSADAATFFTGGPGWYSGTANAGSTLDIGPGAAAPGAPTNGIDGGFFLENKSGSTITIPTVGQVVQGTNVYSFPNSGLAALSIYSVPAPLAGLSLDNTNIGFPAVSKGTYYLQWNGSSGYKSLQYYNAADAATFFTGGAGWYSGTANEDGNPAYWPTAGGSFFIQNKSSQTILWTNVFEVQ
jgi:hypothetical protein